MPPPSLSAGISKNVNAEHIICCRRLREIIIPEENPHLRFVDGVLFNKEMTELIYYLKSQKRKAYTIPASVEVIRESAFGFCDHLCEVVLSENVKEIKAHAFMGCEKLVRIVLSAGLTHIADDAFLYCEKLAEIKVSAGTKERFAAMLPEWTEMIKERRPSHP